VPLSLLLKIFDMNLNTLTKASFLIFFAFACLAFLPAAEAQKRTRSKKNTPIARVVPNTPFNFLIGNWASYSREATFAAYCHVKPIAAGSALEIHLEKPDGTMSVGLIYSDAMDERWKLTWVGPDDDNLTGNGVRYYTAGSDSNRFIFSGNTVLKGKSVLDRYVFENVNTDTVVKSYEISTDNGRSWDVEYKFTFKKNTQ